MEKNEYILTDSSVDYSYALTASNAVPVSNSGSENPADISELPLPLQLLYSALKIAGPGEYDENFFASVGTGISIRDLDLNFVKFTVDDLRAVVVNTSEYPKAEHQNMQVISVQGYANLQILDRFWGTCILIGRDKEFYLSDLHDLLDLINETDEEREERKKAELSKVDLSVVYRPSPANDPIRDAENTNGIYIFVDHNTNKASYDIVLQSMALANIANNPAFGFSLGVKADINTITNTIAIAAGGSLRLATQRYSLTGMLELVGGKINSIGISIDAELPFVPPAVFFTGMGCEVRGFQEACVTMKVFGGMGIGKSVTIPSGLSSISKYFWPNLTGTIRPIDLYVEATIDPVEDYYSFLAKGTFMAAFSVSGGVTYNRGDWDIALRAGTTRNKYFDLSLSVGYENRRENWKFYGDFHGRFQVDWKKLFGVTVQGGINVTVRGYRYNLIRDFADVRKQDLTITVDGMAKVKIIFTFSISVQKSWVVPISSQIVMLNQPRMLMSNSSSAGEISEELLNEAVACESEDIAENTDMPITIGSDAIDAMSWQVGEENGASGTVKFQIASQYTLVDSSWRLTHTATDGVTVTVYTADNAAGEVMVKDFTHNYYELIVDTPEAGSWTLEVLGDEKNTGALYMDALLDEKINTSLEIVEQTAETIKFKYSAFTKDHSDFTVVTLNVEEIAAPDNKTPYVGVLAALEETENGEFIWEIPEEFRNNCKYRFYISMSSEETALPQNSNYVEAETIVRQEADLECSWQLVYSADNTGTVTAFITVTNTGAESTAFQWEILDHTNMAPAGTEDDTDSELEVGEVLVSETCEIHGNSTITLQKVITITDELRDNLNGLQLTVTKCSNNLTRNGGETEEEYVDDAIDLTFAAMDSMYSNDQTITWDAMEGAASYVLQYALEGDWENSAIYINNITDTSYTFSAAPGEYSYRVIALDANGEAIGSWSEEKELEIEFADEHTISINGDFSSSRSGVFTLNDGIYNLAGSGMENFTGNLILYRNDLEQVDQQDNVVTLREKETQILSLSFVNGELSNPVEDKLLDNGDYFWEWTRTGQNISDDSEISMQLSGTVFSPEDEDRDCVSIGGANSDLKQNSLDECIEVIEGEVGFSNPDAIWHYTTDKGGELTLTINAGTVFDANVRVYICVQNETDGDFTNDKTIIVNAGEYKNDTVILDNLSINNNFYIQIESWDKGAGQHNTDYSFALNFDPFESYEQETDIIEIDGSPVEDWIGYRCETHRYLLQVDTDDLYAFHLQGDAGDAILKICNIQGEVIQQMEIQSNGTAEIDSVYLESGNYYVDVESGDMGGGIHNTDYTLSASRMQTLYPVDILEIDGSADSDWVGLQNGSKVYRVQVDADDRFAFRLQGDAGDAILKVCNVRGEVIQEMKIQSDGTAFIDDISLERGNYFVKVESNDMGEGVHNTDFTLAAHKLTSLYPKIDNSNDTPQMAAGLEASRIGENIDAWLGTGDKADFFKFTLDPADKSAQYLILTLNADTVQAVKDGILSFTGVDSSGRDLALGEFSSDQLYIKDPITGLSEVFIGVSLMKSAKDLDYSFAATLQCTPSVTFAWEADAAAKNYTVDIFAEDSQGHIFIETKSNQVSLLGSNKNNLCGRVQINDSGEWSGSSDIKMPATQIPFVLNAVSDGNTDVFFANANDTWKAKYVARHLGMLNGWAGTNEKADLAGKNKLVDIFEGSTDANILLMTDDDNGDALFVEDIYTSFGKDAARFSQIDEIRAGNGDDIVDMTSQRFAYAGDGVKIYGGLGNDTIWANNGSNTLFGDAGNDRIVGGSDDDVIVGGSGNDSLHGGGGNDIFCFGDDWGVDTVEQLAGGKVTLWFEEGSESNWNASTLTYTDGANSVTVSGITEVELKFGDTTTAIAGAFEEAASEKIFEDKIGVIA